MFSGIYNRDEHAGGMTYYKNETCRSALKCPPSQNLCVSISALINTALHTKAMQDYVLLSERIDYGIRLRAERTGETVTPADCARAAGCSGAAVSLWRKNENAITSTYARPLADFFGVDPVWLETGRGYPDREKNISASLHAERTTADQLTTLIRHFFAATPFGRDQLIEFAAAIEKQDDSSATA